MDDERDIQLPLLVGYNTVHYLFKVANGRYITGFSSRARKGSAKVFG